VGQAQVGDVFTRDELSEALAFFSLSRMFAAMVGPLAGGLLCELFGWRSTFWFCACVDAVLLVLSFIYVPETLAIPVEAAEVEEEVEEEEEEEGGKTAHLEDPRDDEKPNARRQCTRNARR
jgi:predicted MFS family arabinose efflux permease